LKEYEGWMINIQGNTRTTVGIYTRSTRAIINEAIESKLMNRECYPFGRRRYGIPTGRNIKKALDKASISKLYYSDLENENQQKSDYTYWKKEMAKENFILTEAQLKTLTKLLDLRFVFAGYSLLKYLASKTYLHRLRGMLAKDIRENEANSVFSSLS
jgi:hypothetical protein